MKSPDARSIAELIGVVAVVLSLAFFGYELKRANDIAEADATANIYQMANDYSLALLANENLRRIEATASTEGPDALEGDDLFIYTTMFNTWHTWVELAWKYNQTGLMSDEDLGVRYVEFCAFLNSSPYNVAHWKSSRDVVIPEFYDDTVRVCNLSE